jgi:hypothetical protein
MDVHIVRQELERLKRATRSLVGATRTLRDELTRQAMKGDSNES